MNRERIEEILAKIEDDKIGEIEPNDLHELCTLALRGLGPMVEWADGFNRHGRWSEANFGQFNLHTCFCDRGVSYTYWEWSVSASDDAEGISFASGTADSLEAAQKAAEDALAKLVGGEE